MNFNLQRDGFSCMLKFRPTTCLSCTGSKQNVMVVKRDEKTELFTSKLRIRSMGSCSL
jgi:hypothetical protein